MLSPVSLMVPLLSVAVLGGVAPGTHPNVTSGDLLEHDDYSGGDLLENDDTDAIRSECGGLPQWVRYDRSGHVVATFLMNYGQQDQIVSATNETLLLTKRRVEGADSDEIWHIHVEDSELKLFFARVLGLRPLDVTVVHMAYSKEESVKKILVKKNVMNAAEIWDKLRRAVS